MKKKRNPSPVAPKKNVPAVRKLLRNPILYLVCFSLIIAYFISYLPTKSLPVLELNEIATTDITSPMDLTIIDEEATEARRSEAAAAVQPVYSLDQNVFTRIESRIREFFNLGREYAESPQSAANIDTFNQSLNEQFGFTLTSNDLRQLARLKFPTAMEESLITLLEKPYEQGIFLAKSLFIHDEEAKGLILIRTPDSEASLQIENIPDIPESRTRLSEEISTLELPEAEKSLLIVLSHHFTTHNISYNPIETSRREQNARDNQETAFYTIKKGKVIIRKGDEAGQDSIKQIQLINENLSAKPSWLKNFTGGFLLMSLLLYSFLLYMKTRPEKHDPLKKFVLTGVLLLLSLVFYKSFLFLAGVLSQNTTIPLFMQVQSYQFAFPLQMGTLLLAFLSGTHLALIFTIINSIMVGYLLQSDFYILLFSLVGGFAAIYGTKYYRKQSRTTPFRSGLALVAPMNILIIIIFHLIRERIGSSGIIASELFMGVIGGLISGVLAYLFLPVFENLFRIITQTRLIEITNSDLPIFRKMAMEAPGSYHHSLIVASLAETAAERIGIDPLITRAGAMYHDIGKTKRPEYFIENHTRKADMHKDLKPSMSTLVIINHVKEGVEIATKLKLPKIVRDIIEQHHGNSLIKYFFEKAKEKYDPEMQTVGEESYRYAGPCPQGKEAAVVLLADSVEAASRSIQKPTKANLKRVITDIINNYLQDGQLDESGLSLKDLKSIADSLLSTLFTIYHPRVEYPGFDFERKKKNGEKPKNSHDRNSKPAE